MTALLMTMLIMVVGTYLIAPVNTAISGITVLLGFNASVVALAALFPLLMVVVLILYVFKGFEAI